MHRTIVIRREYLHYVPKYNRYEKRHKNLAAHVSPAFRVEEGDWVTVGQCRPLSKTVCGISPTVRLSNGMRDSTSVDIAMWLDGLVILVRMEANNILLQVRFNTLRVLPRTGKAVKAFNKF